jgi:magnesium transporter
MIVDCAYYKDGLRQGMSSMPPEEAAGLRGQGGFVWLGLFEPDAEELAQIHQAFGLHELAIEDAQILHRRPKVESYDQDVRLVVVRTARYDDEAEEVDG